MKVVVFLSLIFLSIEGFGFCGFYVAKADTSLYNKASQVVLVRDQNRTVISMLNDYEGNLKDFAMVVPVPVVLKKKQIHVGNKMHFERIDAFTAPRLVEYFDANPCRQRLYKKSRNMPMAAKSMVGGMRAEKEDKDLGVKIEAKYTIGEYDILILSAKESDGLEKWLRQEKYKIPKGASKVLKPYIKQKMKFFVAKVNLKKQVKTGLTYLRPLQFAFESEKFMLPIRLGMINSKGSQDLIVYVLTKSGRVETTNYRTVKLPSNINIPPYVKGEFSQFYKDMFATQVKKENQKVVFTEYFWDMGWCDPCAANPLTPKELRGLGVFWVNKPGQGGNFNKIRPMPVGRRRIRPSGGAQPVKVTRLHVRYSQKTFPADLFFQETSDTQNFQGRYVLQHPWKGSANQCEAAKRYFETLPQRQEKEAQNLARLTGWDINSIRKKIGMKKVKSTNWWEDIW